jgi:hypothetical protein
MLPVASLRGLIYTRFDLAWAIPHEIEWYISPRNFLLHFKSTYNKHLRSLVTQLSFIAILLSIVSVFCIAFNTPGSSIFHPIKTMFKLASLFLLAVVPQGIFAIQTSSAETWFVTHWGAGCVRRGCFYDFNITAPAYGSIPAFSAYCTGDEENANGFFRPCGINDDGLGNRGVAAKFIPRENPNYGSPLNYFAVSFAFTDISTGRLVGRFETDLVQEINQRIATDRYTTSRAMEMQCSTSLLLRHVTLQLSRQSIATISRIYALETE